MRLFLIFFFLVTHMYAHSIDIVYTWVDGSDPNWMQIKKEWEKVYFPSKKDEGIEANSKSRYRDRNELKYSLRSLYKNFPYYNHIYIVTFGQKPAFLKDHPKITIVDHKDIFKHQNHLPTFNSIAIETNLHRVPGLLEKFIYVNDDVFFAKKMGPRDFFDKKGRIRVFLSGRPAYQGKIDTNEAVYISAWKNAANLLRKKYKQKNIKLLGHAPFALKKTLMQKAERQFQSIFDLVSSHKFRQHSDHVITNGLVQYYAHAKKQATLVKKLEAKRMGIGSNQRLNQIEMEKYKKEQNKQLFLCIEDFVKDDTPAVDKQVQDFLEVLFPEKAPWEI